MTLNLMIVLENRPVVLARNNVQFGLTVRSCVLLNAPLIVNLEVDSNSIRDELQWYVSEVSGIISQ